ncbi:MAG: hypothetical protein ACRCR9_00670 [Chitinophagaceae bacterium]
MQNYKWTISTLPIISMCLLFFNCNKSEIAQVDFSAKLASRKAYSVGPPEENNKYFQIDITIRSTAKVAALYPKAQFYLTYIIYDKQGNVSRDCLYDVDTAYPSFPIIRSLLSDSFRNISYRMISNIVNKDYNIKRTTSTPYYKILFTLVIKDTINNQFVEVPTVSPKEAQRMLEVFVDPDNPDEASYILSFKYKKNAVFRKNFLNNYLSPSLVRINKNYIG